MLSNFILKHENTLYCFYYTDGKGILYKTYQNNRWSGEYTIVKNARENYSITPGPDGSIYLFCQDAQGDIVLSTYKNQEWNRRIVLKNESSKINTVVLNPIITKKGLCIIYNMPPGEERSSYLVMQQLSDSGQWSPASRIDKFMEMNSAIYQVQYTSPEHLLLFYQTHTPENNLGYREMTPTQMGGFNIFHTTSYYIADTSFLTTSNGVHVLYIVKSMFSSQLIYRKKTDRLFSNPIVLSEGQKIDNCLLTIIKDNLYATFMSNDHLYICTSEDKGNTFSRAVRYRKKFCLSPVKATYLTTSPMSENSLYIRHVYVDKSSPWDIQLIPEMYEDFFVVAESKNRSAPPPEESDDINKLRNQLLLSRRQSEEKDKQLLRLTDLLKEKKEEITLIETQKKAANKRLSDELTELKNRIAELENENKQLKESINDKEDE